MISMIWWLPPDDQALGFEVMATIPAHRPESGYRVVEPAELAKAPTLVVDVGTAPDGLPWLLAIDRTPRLSLLYQSVVAAFELSSADELPDGVKRALATDVASGLMGVHTVTVGGKAVDVYVSRRSLSRLVGDTLLSQLLIASDDTPAASNPVHHCATSANPIGSGYADEVDRFERALRESQTRRHLLVAVTDGSAHVGGVTPEDRALRTPSGPVRRLVRESLAALSGTRAIFDLDGQRWEVPLADTGEYVTSLARVGETYRGGTVSYAVPRQSILETLVRLARELGALHQRGLVHGDLSPANVLVEDGRAVAFDALGVERGQVAFAGTFDWAAPEQVLARPLDPRADVFAVGKMLCALVGGVPFGEKTTYTVPTGGLEATDVAMLKTDGVYVDTQGTEHGRDWQAAWQDLLARCLSFDRERRPADGPALADELAELAGRFALDGRIVISGSFGAIVPMARPAVYPYARLMTD